MPKGLKSKSNKNKTHKLIPGTSKQELLLKSDMEEYAKITKLCGDCRCMIVTPDNTETMAHIPGKFRKKVWFTTGNIVLISRRDYQQNVVDVLHKYSPSEVIELHKIKEIPDTFLVNEKVQNEQGFLIVTEEDQEINVDDI